MSSTGIQLQWATFDKFVIVVPISCTHISLHGQTVWRQVCLDVTLGLTDP